MANELETALESKPEEIQAAKPSESAPDNSVNPQTNGSANTVTEKVPFHKDPEVQKYLDKQLSRREREWSEKIRGIEDMYRGKLENLTASLAPKNAGDPPMTPDQKNALLSLVKLIKSDPDAAKELGLGSSEELKKEIENIQWSKAVESFDSEASSVANTYAERYGLDKGEFEEELREFIQSHPYFNQSPYSQGMLEIAAMTMTKDRQAELADRAANLKIIKEQQEKKKISTERPAGGKAADKKAPKSLGDFLRQRVAEAGGLKVE